jgi:hypothetical protein
VNFTKHVKGGSSYKIWESLVRSSLLSCSGQAALGDVLALD